jgi:hypothetical protein
MFSRRVTNVSLYRHTEPVRQLSPLHMFQREDRQMSREGVGQILEAMSDDDVRGRVESGDLAGLKGAEGLTEEETRIVIAAAGDYPDTGGFTMGGLSLSFGNPLDDHGSFGQAAHYAIGGNIPAVEIP